MVAEDEVGASSDLRQVAHARLLSESFLSSFTRNHWDFNGCMGASVRFRLQMLDVRPRVNT